MHIKDENSIEQSLKRLLQLSGIENNHETDSEENHIEEPQNHTDVHPSIEDLEKELESLRFKNKKDYQPLDLNNDYFKDRKMVLIDLQQEDYDYGHDREELKVGKDIVYHAPSYKQKISHGRFSSNPLDTEVNESKLIFSNINENDSKILETLSDLVSRPNDISLFTGLHKIKTGMTKSINEEETKSIAIAFINLLKEDQNDSINSFYTYFKELEEKNLLNAYKEHINNVDIDVSDFIKMHGKHPEKIYESKRWAIDFGNKIEFFDGFFDEVKKSIISYAEQNNYKGVIKVSP